MGLRFFRVEGLGLRASWAYKVEGWGLRVLGNQVISKREFGFLVLGVEAFSGSATESSGFGFLGLA